MTLNQIQSRFRTIADQLGSRRSLPTTPQDDGIAHAEHLFDNYFFVRTERGAEFERRVTKVPDELLSWFVRDLTSEIASNWELTHRMPGEDSRRLYFKKHVELLRSINESWADLQQDYYDTVLTRSPFDDTSGDRVDYFLELQQQGVENQNAWQRALMKFPKNREAT